MANDVDKFPRAAWEVRGGSMNRIKLSLVTPAELKTLPTGTVLYDIFGVHHVVGEDDIDEDTRGGFTAFGVLEDV